MNKFKSNLRNRILAITAFVIISLMLFISVILLFQWREIIISKETNTVRSISNTFAVTVVDALIFEEKSIFQKDNILETYIDNFINRLGNVKYVVIYDRGGNRIINRFLNENKEIVSDEKLGFRLASLSREIVSISNDKKFGWTNEVKLPFNFANKVWGAAVIGFDAEPLRGEIRSLFFILLGATILVTLFVLTILFFSINHVTSSLDRLVLEIDKIDLTSDYNISLPVKDDEIGFLYHHFRLLTERLNNSKRQLERAQKQIYQAEKLASIGRLAAGVAHQVNNPLNGIKSCIYALNREPENLEQNKEYLALIDEGITNIETIVKKLLGFARQQSKSDNLININDTIEKVITLFDYRIKDKKISLKPHLNELLPSIRGDYHLIQEVVMNLLLNSLDAIEEEGTIEIRTDFSGEQNVVISVKDNGTGIKKENLKDIFEPFYTTKELGVGTGLGLSASLDIIHAHNGKITVESTEGVETTFTVILPIGNTDENINN
ncbi:MAG: ATP-binding protein [Ignavibacteriaceae bacterium]